MLRLVAEAFGPEEFGLEAALPGAGGDIVASAAAALAERFGAALERLWDDNRGVLGSLAVAGHPLAPELRAPVVFAVGRRLRAALAVGGRRRRRRPRRRRRRCPGGRPSGLGGRAARRRPTPWPTPRVADALAAAVLAAVRRALADADAEPAAKVVRELLRLRRPLGIDVDLDRPQELVVDALAARPGDEPLRLAGRAVGVAAT